MPLPHPLLEVATDLAADAAAKAAFAADPEGFLAERGLDDWTAEDLGTALEHVGDTLPPELSAQLGEVGPEADPAEVFGLLADVETEPRADELAFGEGEDPGDHADDADDGPDPEVADVQVDVDLEDAGELPEAAWDEPLDDDLDGVEDGGDEVDLEFGAGADDLQDDLPE